VEPQSGERVGGTVQRVNPTVLAAVALGALILLIVGMMVIGRQSSEDDRLLGDEVAAVRQDPQEYCSNRATYDEIKHELFRRAMQIRGKDYAAYEKIASQSSVRMEAPVLRDESGEGGSVTCNGTLTLDLPSEVTVAGGRRSLSADILYTLQPDSRSVTIADADEIVRPLATLVRTVPAADQMLNEMDPTSSLPGVEPPQVIDPLAPIPEDPASGAQPSFNCANASTSSEVAVCNNPALAALDRRMAAQYAGALSGASPAQRAVLESTRNAFLRYRDACSDDACIAETYRGRMREIRDIMLGSWRPGR
jgi:uncharacterized protein YecT (DUF1311 family)